MNKDELKEIFDKMTPDEIAKSRMKRNLILHQHSNPTEARSPKRRLAWFILPAISLTLALIILWSIPFGSTASVYAIHVKVGEDRAVLNLAGRQDLPSNEQSTSVSYVDPRPGLEFYIEGDDIATIEMTTENEYIYAVDWTKTQHEKFWNLEYYQYFDEEKQRSIADFSLLYDKSLAMNFEEGFTEYDQIWYRWHAWNMHQWASEDNFSKFYGVGFTPDLEQLSEEEKMKLAAGEDSAVGHMQLDEYPEHLKEDRIWIKITDRQGQVTTKVIHVKVSNNEARQTVVTAKLLNE